ncbi:MULTISPECIES: phosphopantetheine-binding protein [Janthinobacterium]|uniref:phosphopantetheine-binding protein n=1 Tax=Janthinobacterium TaxID=29580 RepID=UPI0015961A6E|nr:MULTISPECIES: phosphopantetheine-binding protein [unclassified Janthinobacterium]MBW3509295.1 hypothetical protein [Janthinobacterium sp. NKUCC06_STL]NVI83610.1 hypothetical protein [Janthinobacterium sp. BJB401]
MRESERVIYEAIRKVKPSLIETELTPATRFDKFDIASLEMAMIVFEINDAFDIEIELYTLMTLDTIEDACVHVDQERRKSGAVGTVVADA